MKKLIALVAVLAMTLTAGAAFAGSITVKGSTTVLPLMQKVAEAYMKAHPNVKISISGGGSSNGAKALIDGTTDIAMMSRDMKGKEEKAAKANGRDPVQFVISLDCIVPIVNPANTLDNMTTDKLKSVYMGKTTKWGDLGWDGGRIAVISRDTSSGTYEVWEKLVMNKERVYPGALLQASNGAVAQAVAKNDQAVGYVGLGYLNEEIKGLTVNGIEASVETARSGEYPISRGLNVYTPGQPAGEVKNFIDFIMSPAGQKMAAEIGFVPVK